MINRWYSANLRLKVKVFSNILENQPENKEENHDPNEEESDAEEQDDVEVQNDDVEPAKGINLVTDKQDDMFNHPDSDREADIKQKTPPPVDDSIEKGVFDEANPKSVDNGVKDDIAKYEQMISEKLEQKRKDELKKASESMKVKLVRTGRCPICTLAPPCNHYEDENDIKQANRSIISNKNSPRKSLPNSQSPKGPATKIVKSKITSKIKKHVKNNDKLNRTTFEIDKNKISKDKSSKKKTQRKKSNEGGPITQEEAIPVIKDEDFNSDLDSKEVTNEQAKSSEGRKTSRKNAESQPPTKDGENQEPKPSAQYNMSRRRRTNKGLSNPPRVHSHHNRAKIRIQGRHGVSSHFNIVETGEIRHNRADFKRRENSSRSQTPYYEG